MPIELQNVEADKCYVTSSGQVRRVLKVETNITYESRGKDAIRRGEKWNPKQSVRGEKFVAAVDREVTCDYDPNPQVRFLSSANV